MTNLSMFLDKDQEKASKELDCYDYLMMHAIESVLKGDFNKASAYHENMARSLKELDRMKKDKALYDEAWLILKQIEGDKQQRNLLYKLQVNIYE